MNFWKGIFSAVIGLGLSLAARGEINNLPIASSALSGLPWATPVSAEYQGNVPLWKPERVARYLGATRELFEILRDHAAINQPTAFSTQSIPGTVQSKTILHFVFTDSNRLTGFPGEDFPLGEAPVSVTVRDQQLKGSSVIVVVLRWDQIFFDSQTKSQLAFPPAGHAYPYLYVLAPAFYAIIPNNLTRLVCAPAISLAAPANTGFRGQTEQILFIRKFLGDVRSELLDGETRALFRRVSEGRLTEAQPEPRIYHLERKPEQN